MDSGKENGNLGLGFRLHGFNTTSRRRWGSIAGSGCRLASRAARVEGHCCGFK